MEGTWHFWWSWQTGHEPCWELCWNYWKNDGKYVSSGVREDEKVLIVCYEFGKIESQSEAGDIGLLKCLRND